MTPQQERDAEVLKELGLDRLPPPRIDVPEAQAPITGANLLNYKKAMQTIDILESAALERYIPLDVVIDQSLDARIFHPELTKGIGFRTDVPIPSNEMVFRATGIGEEQNPENQRRWLGQCVARHFQEFGVRAISPPLVFKWMNGTPPMMGCIIKLDPRKRYENAGANWGLLGEKKTTKVITENEDEERLMGTR